MELLVLYSSGRLHWFQLWVRYPDRIESRCLAKFALAISVIGNLMPLFIFKYYYFFVGSFGGIFGIPSSFLAIQIILPVAISFYTFEAISYNVDIRRGVIIPRRNLVEFSLFIFFPA